MLSLFEKVIKIAPFSIPGRESTERIIKLENKKEGM